MKKVNCTKPVSHGVAGDMRGTAYVNEAAKPFKSNGVSSTAVFGGDLRTRNGQRTEGAK